MVETLLGKIDMMDRYENLNKRLLEIKGLMRPFQISSVGFFQQNKRGLVEAPVGAGKTLIGWTSALTFKPTRILVVCSKNALYTWPRELDKWFPGFFKPEEIQVIDGHAFDRQKQWADTKVLIKITTFGKILADVDMILEVQRKHPFDVIVVDEAHRARNRKAKTFKALSQISRPTSPGYPRFIELTGTPGDKGVEHLWGYFHLADPKHYTSYWRFVNTYCDVVDSRFGKQIIGPKNTKGFELHTRTCFKRIEVAETGLHKIVRHVVPIDMSPAMRKVYNQFEEEMIASMEDDGDGFMVASTSLAKTVKARQFLTYPGKFFPSLGLGELLPWICDTIDDNDSANARHCIVFTPFRDNIPVYAQYLRERYKIPVIELSGGMDPKLLTELVAQCNKDMGMAVCTTQYAQSFEFPKMNCGYMAGYDWSADTMEQAEGRFRRLTTQGISNAFYPQFRGTIDEWLMFVLDRKTIDRKVLFQSFKNRETAKTIGTSNSS